MYIQYGEWKINADIIKTKMYYGAFSKPNDQFSRNFQMYCDKLSNEEKEFFASFGIDPKCAYIQGLGVTDKKTAPCGGCYYIFGNYESAPAQPSISIEELIKNGLEAYSKDNSVKIGAFRFEFQLPFNPNADIPESMPENCICVRFWCEDMQWLLDEKCEKSLREVSHFEKLLTKLIKRPSKEKSKKEQGDTFHQGKLITATNF